MIAWLASSGVVQGVIIGATLAFLTTILILDTVAKSETRTVKHPRSGIHIEPAADVEHIIGAGPHHATGGRGL